jgi:hypothetical protein
MGRPNRPASRPGWAASPWPRLGSWPPPRRTASHGRGCCDAGRADKADGLEPVPAVAATGRHCGAQRNAVDEVDDPRPQLRSARRAPPGREAVSLDGAGQGGTRRQRDQPPPRDRVPDGPGSDGGPATRPAPGRPQPALALLGLVPTVDSRRRPSAPRRHWCGTRWTERYRRFPPLALGSLQPQPLPFSRGEDRCPRGRDSH